MNFIVGPTDGESIDLGGLGVRFMVTGEGFSLVEHPIVPAHPGSISSTSAGRPS
jgi:hypothetical protein